MKFIDLNKTEVYRDLEKIASSFRDFDFGSQLVATRVEKCLAPMAAGLSFSWAAKSVDQGVLNLLQTLSEEQELAAKYRVLLNGEVMNTGENRKVLHHLLRSAGGLSAAGQAVTEDGRDIGAFYNRERERFSAFASDVRSGKITGTGGKPFTVCVQIGIGGSDLGPRAMYLALEHWAAKEGKRIIPAKFISNVDPDDASALVS
ncbi:MAG: glucose-6-phosphate isomerase, partial [Treponema sp.]|nr:glucose-6-phosphate isomerase [Treponema sp.]